MYGTIAKVQLKPGREAEAIRLMWEFEGDRVPGSVAEYLYRSGENPDEYYLAVVFESKEAYIANADSPEQDARHRRLAALFAAEPEWHDGEIVFSATHRPRSARRSVPVTVGRRDPIGARRRLAA
jgi:heme-degrading monooxygenase HmoA